MRVRSVVPAIAVPAIAVAVLVAALPGTAHAGSPPRLPRADRQALTITAVKAVADRGGLSIEVTTRGRLEDRLGRGRLRQALLAVVLAPRAGTGRPSALGVAGPERRRITARATRSRRVAATVAGRRARFYLRGTGAQNVDRIYAIGALPTRRRARTAQTGPNAVPGDVDIAFSLLGVTQVGWGAGQTPRPDQWTSMVGIGTADIATPAVDPRELSAEDCDPFLAELERANLAAAEAASITAGLEARFAHARKALQLARRARDGSTTARGEYRKQFKVTGDVDWRDEVRYWQRLGGTLGDPATELERAVGSLGGEVAAYEALLPRCGVPEPPPFTVTMSWEPDGANGVKITGTFGGPGPYGRLVVTARGGRMTDFDCPRQFEEGFVTEIVAEDDSVDCSGGQIIRDELWTVGFKLPGVKPDAQFELRVFHLGRTLGPFTVLPE